MEQGIEIYQQKAVEIQKAPELLTNHRFRWQKAQCVVKSMLEKANKEMNDDMYKNIGLLLKKLSTTKKTFYEERLPFAKIMNEITSAFTELENSLDYNKEGTDAYKLKFLMDEYAGKKVQDQKNKEEESRKKIEREREINTVRISAKTYIERFCSNAVQKMKDNIDEIINSVTLENFDQIKKKLTSYDTRVPEGLLNGFDVEVTTIYIKQDEKETILEDVLKSVNWEEFKEPYNTEISIYLHDKISRLASIKRELEEIATADKNEQQRLLKVKQEREEQEKQQKEKEKRDAELAEKEKELQRIKQAEIQSAFDFGTSVEVASDIKSKLGYEIDLVLPAGLMDIVRFWAINQKWPMDEDKLMRWSFDRIKKFCEKEASNDNFIESDFVNYREIVKSKI